MRNEIEDFAERQCLSYLTEFVVMIIRMFLITEANDSLPFQNYNYLYMIVVIFARVLK